MTEAKVRIAYTGTALQDGSMEVVDLAPALLAFAGFIQRANEVIGNRQPVKITLKADDIHKGSFEIVLSISSILEQAKLMMGMAESSGLAALLQIIGYSRTGVLSIFDLIKLCRGKKPDAVKHTENGVNVTANNSTVNVTYNVFNIFKDPEARSQLERVTKPLGTDGIDGFEIRNNKDMEDKTAVVSVAKSEQSFFVVQSTDETETEQRSTQNLMLNVVSVAFGENQKWRFSDGESTFWASVADEQFLKRVETGEQAFRNGDKIQAECQIVQKISSGGKLTAERTITKVLKYIEIPQQEKLF